MYMPHVLAIPYPAQGHVIPLLEFSQCLVMHGCKVTFVNTDHTHKRVVNALVGKNYIADQIHLVSIPDGIEPWEDRNDLGKLSEAIVRVMPGKLEELIEDINRVESDKITCVIADGCMGWAIEVANKMKIKRAVFWPAAAGLLAMIFSISKLIDDGVIDKDAFTSIPEVLPIGPLLARNRLGNSTGYFWTEDSACLKWLDKQPPHSVVYVAFGSFTVFDQVQFQELALGLELSNRPFLWVVRPDITNDANDAYPEGFKYRVANRGQMVGWSPQQKVLSHPSIACFLSHCGWNSTLEGISNGVPFLCWPYFADQFLNEGYICDAWKVGLKFNKNNSGIITREEIKSKVDQVLGDKNFKARAMKLKETAMNSVREGGHSNSNFNNFLEWMKP